MTKQTEEPVADLASLLHDDLLLTAVRSGESFTRDALLVRVEARAGELAQMDLRAGDRVVVALWDPVECLVSLFACWHLRLVAVLVNPDLRGPEKKIVANATQAALWIDEESIAALHAKPFVPASLEDAALILMTSGTTGVPKGVTLSLRAIRERLAANVAAIGQTNLSQTFCTLPLYFGHGLIGNALTALYAGQHVHLMPRLTVSEMGHFGELLTDRKISFLSSVPSFWRMVLSLSTPPRSPLARVHVGSAPLSHDLWHEIAEWCGTDEVYNTYGMTETANWISGGVLHDPRAADGYVGKPWGGTFRVLKGNELSNEGEGQVAVKSPGQMLGFWGQPDKTEDTMLGDYLLTGDIGVLSPDQSLQLIGRSKNEINVAGIKVLAEEVDLLLERHPAVREACAFAVPDKIAGERVGAVVQLDTKGPEAAEVIGWCRAQARAEAVPARVEIVDEIPKNDRGKISRKDVQAAMVRKWF